MHDEQPGNLPAAILKLRDEVEKLGCVEVEWTPEPDLEGYMSAEWQSGRPIIFHKQYTHAGAAHELLHLKLDVMGFKRPHVARPVGYLGLVTTLLHNVLQHAVIFPTLLSMGFFPDEVECIAALSWFKSLTKKYPDVQDIGEHPGGTALLAMLYLRASYRCPAHVFCAELQGLFQEPQFADAFKMAERVQSEISLGRYSSAEDYNGVLTRCIDALGLVDVVTTGDPRENVSD